MKEPTHILPVEALFNENLGPNRSAGFDPRKIVDEADVIFVVDVMTKRQSLVYGRDTLKQIVKSGATKKCRVLHIGIDEPTDDLEKVVALVRVVKGHDDYEDGPAAPGGRG